MWVMCSECGDLFQVDDELVGDADPEEDILCVPCGEEIFDGFHESFENDEGLIYE